MRITYFLALVLLIFLQCERDKTPIYVLTSPVTSGFWRHVGPTATNVRSLYMTRDDKILAGLDDGISMSRDHGQSWDTLFFQTSLHTFTVTADENNNFFAGTSAGVYFSNDSGQNWQKLFASTSQFTDIAINSQGNILTSILHYGTFISTDNGNSWQDISPPSTVSQIEIDSNDRIYCGRPWIEPDFHSLYISSDNGSNWLTIKVEPSNGYTILDELILNGKDEIFLVTDNGLFQYIKSNHTLRKVGLDGYYANCMAQNRSGTMFIGTYYKGILVSFDEGETWYTLSNELAGNDFVINALALDSNGYLYAGVKNRGVFKSRISTRLLNY